MKYENAFLNVLEEMRKDRKMSVTELVDGIASPKTYRRYLLNSSEISVTKLFHLADRLSANLHDILYYLLYDYSGGINFDNYLNHLILRNFEEVNDSYDNIEEWTTITDDQETLIQVSKWMYQGRHMGKDTSKELENVFHNFVEPNITKTPYSLYFLSLLVIYYAQNPHNAKIDLDLLIDLVSKRYYAKQRNLVYLMTATGVISLAMMQSYKDIQKLKPIVALFQEFAMVNQNQYLVSRGKLYQAYICYLEGDNDKTEELLFQYANGLRLVADKTEIRAASSILQNVFGIGMAELVKNRFSRLV